MGKAISYAKRKKIIERRQLDHTFKSIALDLGLSESGVKKIWYAYQKKGESALQTNYSNCGSTKLYNSETEKKVNALRTNEQGAAFVHSKFLLKHPGLKAPSPRTIQRWWKKQSTNRPVGRPPKEEKKNGVAQPMKYGK